MHSLVVISSYPPKGTTHHKSVIGGASYTKNTLIALKKEATARHKDLHITVLSQEIEGSPRTYTDEDITVKRIWKRNSLLTFGKLYKEIITHHKQTKEILIELELNIFGKSPVFLGLLLNFIFSLKLLNKKVTLVIHEVIFDMGKFGPHINLKEKSSKTSIVNTGLNVFYKAICRPVDNIIVFEESLKSQLSKITGQGNKIHAIAIAVENVKDNLSKEKARQKLGIPQKDFVVMTFGFLAWYKGTDWLADVWPELEVSKEIKVPKVSNAKIPFDTSDTFPAFDTPRLIIAGGANPNRIDLPYYKKYLSDLEKTCSEKDILLTGFVPEEKMQLYFATSDIVIFPYRTLMQSSAVLSMAFSYGVPILLSNAMHPIFQAKDIKEELTASDLHEEDVLFPLDDTFIKRLEMLKSSHQLLEKIANFSKRMKQKRSWDKISKKYYDVLFGES